MKKHPSLLRAVLCVLLCAALCPVPGLFAARAEGELPPAAEAVTVDAPEDVRDLVYGDEGEDVTQLQQRLADLGYYTAAVSGKFREATRAAVKRFQEDFDLEVTGEADAATQNVLYATLYRPLRVGDSGETVTRLQKRLKALGWYDGAVTGNYQESTRDAVKAFQEECDTDVTGIADPDTQIMLYADGASAKGGAQPEGTPAPETLELEEDTGDAGAAGEDLIPYTKRLASGSSGALVKDVQQRLTDLGYYSGPVSGNFLKNTHRAVKAFQKQNGLSADGIVGEMTWNALFNDPDVVLPLDPTKPTPEPTLPPYYIVVDVTNQAVIVYGLDEQNEYTAVVRKMICSTGTKKFPSDVGDWVTNGRRAKWCYFPKWGGYARWWTRINSGIAFHSVCYNAVDNKAMSTSSYKALGKRASHGCVRLLVDDAKWVYDNVREGTTVHITESLPDDPELRAAVTKPALNKRTMAAEVTPEPTAAPDYERGAVPPLPLEEMRKNDSSEAVYWLQSKLKDLGYYTGTVTGTYLGGTVNAVKAYQKAVGMKANGVATVALLETLYAEELSEPEATPEPTLEIVEMTLPAPEEVTAAPADEAGTETETETETETAAEEGEAK